MTLIKQFSLLITGLMLFSSCAEPPEFEEPLFEKPYCSAIKTYISPVTVTGSATFQARESSASGLGAAGPPKPIRNAEIRILDSSGKTIQCSETDENGAFSFLLSPNISSYTIRISSRANNGKLKVSILKSPENQVSYYIHKSFNIFGFDVNLGAINASATGDVKGGAFNIMEQIWQANNFLRQQITTAKCASYGCSPFTVAPHVTVYWSKGVNPGSYFNVGPVSFYIPSKESLYILGGVNGDVDNSDTDHFDNTIILHEYGHFIEHKFADTDSPGGSHSGNSIIDPRLAWGEGWASFFQAAIRGTPVYQDTIGNSDRAPGSPIFNAFYENLETPNNDIPSTLGEGNFREFSVTRTLWDFIDPHPITGNGENGSNDGSEEVTLDFSELWSVFTSASNGFKSSDVHFRNAGYFYSFLLDLDGGTNDIASALINEKQRGTRQDYGQPVSTGGSCSRVDISGSSLGSSNQFSDNDFYELTLSGDESTLTLKYEQVDGTDLTDLDLFLYRDGYTYYKNDEGLAGSSDRYRDSEHEDARVGETEDGSEVINLEPLSAGTYMINVKIFEDTIGSGANYTLELNGSSLCPN